MPQQLTIELEDRRTDAWSWRRWIPTVPGHETWFHYHQPKPKKQAKNSSSTKLKNFCHTTIGWNGYADSFLGWTRSNFGILHTQGGSQQSNVSRTTYLLLLGPQSLTSEYWYFVFCCNIVLDLMVLVQRLQPSKFGNLNVYHIHRILQTRTYWFSSFWSTQRGARKQVFKVRRRGFAGWV